MRSITEENLTKQIIKHQTRDNTHNVVYYLFFAYILHLPKYMREIYVSVFTDKHNIG